MPTYKAEPGTEIMSTDQQGNVWPEPLVFGKDGLLKVPESQQDVITALEVAAANGSIEKVKKAPPPISGNRKEN
jgi:hypothetical protein